MRVLTWAVALAILGSGCTHFECELHGGSQVRAIKTDHFVVTSDLPLDAHRKQAERLELLWDTFAAFFGTDVEHAEIPVVVLQSGSAVESFAPGYAGFVRRDGPTVLVVAAAGGDGSQDTNAHELTHLVSSFMLPRQPRWLAEGLGTLFEDATFKNERTVKMGRWNETRAQEAFVVGALGLEELGRWGELRFDSSEALLYASAWAWVHYLINHDEARLRRLFVGLRSERPLAQVMEEVFPKVDLPRLHAEVKAYLGQARFRGWETSLRRAPKLEAPVVLQPWEVHALRSRLFLKDQSAAKNDLEKAVALAPSPMPPLAAVWKAKLEKREAKTLLASYPNSAPVLVAAWAPYDVEANRTQVEQALETAGSDVGLLLLAGNLAYFEKDFERATTYAVRGGTLAPWSLELAVLRLRLAIDQRHCGEASLLLSQAASLLPERAADVQESELSTLRKRVEKCKPHVTTFNGTNDNAAAPK